MMMMMMVSRELLVSCWYIVCVLLCLVCRVSCYHMTWGPIYNSFDQKYDELQPQDVMVDYINRVGLYLLDVHNEDNLHNNIALSPYGAVSVLIALAEGLRGDAALEIYRASHIPHDLTIIRIGLRDIHRHLKSYFIPREGFLAGLTLSHENVTLSESYERILRFYGYDLDAFNGGRVPINPSSPSIAPPLPPEEPDEARTEPRTSTTTETPRLTTTSEKPITIPVVEVTTEVAGTTTVVGEEVTVGVTVPAVEGSAGVTIPVVEVTTKMAETTTGVVGEEASTAGVVGAEVSTASAAGGEASTAKVVGEEVSTAKTVETTTEDETEVVNVTTANNVTTQSTTDGTSMVSTTSNEVFVAITTESEAELLTTTTTAQETTTATPQQTLQAVKTMSSANLASKTINNTTGKIEMITAINIQTKQTQTTTDDQTNTKRNQRSIIDYLIARYYDDYYIPKKYNFPKFRPRIPFFIDGIHRIDRAYFMTYDTVLPLFYMADLDAVALSFPLDNANYYLLLILPLREDGIDDLICDLKENPDLKFIIRNMKYTHVKAIIPSFTLKGHVNLTPSLQRLGIQKIFEPHHADFTPMTNNKDVYVTNIEQAITVKIRNYVDLGIASDHGNIYRYAPVEFKADHPFLYFVMDSQMHVALMAGKIIDPLSSRIR